MNVSFLLPVYNTDKILLRICINSILHTLEDKHELIVVNDASEKEETLDQLEKLRQLTKPNIVVVDNASNSGVSYSLNRAAGISSRPLLAPIDHDDLLMPGGFQDAMRYLKYYRSEWIYTDEIQIDHQGFLINNFFKPAYSKHLLRSLMYLNHLQIFSRDLFSRTGGYRIGFEGSQDHDLALRMSEIATPRHAPVLAYQWRIQTNTLSRVNSVPSPKVIERSSIAIREHLTRLGLDSTVTLAISTGSAYKIRLKAETTPKVSVIIPCKLGTQREINGVNHVLLEHCLQYLERTTSDFRSNYSDNFEVVIVINAEDDKSAANGLLEHFSLAGKVVSDEPGFNFSRKCNLGATHSNGNILVFLNDDTQFLTNNWLDTVISMLVEDDVACVGGLLLNADGSVQSCGDIVGHNAANHYCPRKIPDTVGDPMHRYVVDHETTSITGAFLCCRSNTFETLDGFNEELPNSFQDVDFCLRSRRQGLRCILSPEIKLFHFESSSREPTVDMETLSFFRHIHSDTIASPDLFQLWKYQPVHVKWFSLQGLIYARRRFPFILRNVAREILRRIGKKPRARYKYLID